MLIHVELLSIQSSFHLGMCWLQTIFPACLWCLWSFLGPPLTATLAPKRREQQTQSLNAVLPPGPTLWVGLSTRAGNLAEIDRNRGIKKGPFRDILLDPMGPPFQDPPGGFVGFTQHVDQLSPPWNHVWYKSSPFIVALSLGDHWDIVAIMMLIVAGICFYNH